MSLLNINVMFWNCRSIRNKIFELIHFLNSNNVDICLLSETWLSDENTFYHPQYSCVRRDRVGRNGGGVAILVKKTIQFNIIPCIATEVVENVGIEISFRENSNLRIYSVYFPGGQNNSVFRNKFKSDIRKMLNMPYKYLICGDLNSRHRSWNCLRANPWGNILHDCLSHFPVTISFPSTPTFFPAAANLNPSTLDLILSNIPEFLSHPITKNDLNSDHLPIMFHVLSSTTMMENWHYNFKRANWKKYKHVLENKFQNRVFDIQNINSTEEIDSEVNYFTSSLLEATRESVPKCSPKNNYIKLPEYILNLIKIRNRYSREWTRYRQLSDYYIMVNYSNIIRHEIHQFRNRQWNARLSQMNKASKPFWNVTKILKKKKSQCHTLLNGTDVVISNEDKCNVFANSFLRNHKVSEHLGTAWNNELVNRVIEHFDSLDITTPNTETISLSDTVALIKNTHIRKSCGLDEINNQMMKQLPSIAIVFLTNIYNSCLKLQYFPSSWKTAKVVPIPKPGKPLNRPDSYRPISLLSSLGKLLEKIIKIKIEIFIGSKNILPNEQFGFRNSHSTIHQVKRITNDVKEGFNSGKSAALVLLDVEKAFDSVWHRGLVYKLINFEFPLYIIKFVRNFLNNRYFCVAIDNVFSDLLEIPAGVPQGSVLGPTLYNIFCADMPRPSTGQLAAFADDLAIYYSHELSQNILTELQCSLNALEDYYFKWKIKLNSDKTQAIFFSRKRKPCYLPNSNLTLSGATINWSDNVKYLGIYLDKKLTFNTHISNTIEKVNKYKKNLYPLINRNSTLSNHNKILIFKVIFQAILLYGCPVWGLCAKSHLRKLQISQNKILKMILKLPWHFSTDRLHVISKTNTILFSVEKITNRFHSNCRLSDNILISSLYS